MKHQVHRSMPTTILTVDNVNNNYFYGVKVGAYYGRGFVTTKSYLGEYVLRNVSGLTKGDGWSSWPGISDLRTFLVAILDKGPGWEVYQFDTHKELLNWLLEE